MARHRRGVGSEKFTAPRHPIPPAAFASADGLAGVRWRRLPAAVPFALLPFPKGAPPASCDLIKEGSMQHVISIDSVGRGRFDAYYGGSDRLLVANTPTPFLNGARALLAEGLAAPDDLVVMVHRLNPLAECLRAKVGKAAKLDRGKSAAAAPPIAPAVEAGTRQRAAESAT
jgi:hypothetical protein